MSEPVTVQRADYPPLAKVANAAAAVAVALRLPLCNLEVDSIVRAAQRQTGLEDYGDPYFKEGLQRILTEAQEVDFTSLSHIVLRQGLIRAVNNRLWTQAYLDKHPEVRDIPIERPVFVLGFPRTGTTVLQNLLSLSPRRRALRFWELLLPVPTGLPDKEDEQERMRQTRSILRMAYIMAPEMRSIHEITTNSLEECWPLFIPTGSVFNYDLGTGLTKYGDWLLQKEMVTPYQEYKLALQILLHQRGADRLVLKCPEHLWFLDALLEVFPDACIVWTHRDPASSVASYCSLISMNRRLYWGKIDHEGLGRDISRRFVQGVHRAIDVLDKTSDERFFHVNFSEFVQDPVAMAGRICEHFGLEHTPADVTAMQAWMDNDRADHRGAHRYSAELYGLDPHDLHSRFARYIEHFQIRIDKRWTETPAPARQ